MNNIKKIIEIWYYPESFSEDQISKNPIELSIGYGKVINNELVEIKGKKSTKSFIQSETTFISNKKPISLYCYHELGSYKLNNLCKEMIDNFIESLDNYKDYNYMIEGNTCNIGKKEDNLKLSLDRAKSVKNYLMEKWYIAEDKITIVGNGDGNPLYNNNNEKIKKFNRRTDIKIIFKSNT